MSTPDLLLRTRKVFEQKDGEINTLKDEISLMSSELEQERQKVEELTAMLIERAQDYDVVQHELAEKNEIVQSQSEIMTTQREKIDELSSLVRKLEQESLTYRNLLAAHEERSRDLTQRENEVEQKLVAIANANSAVASPAPSSKPTSRTETPEKGTLEIDVSHTGNHSPNRADAADARAYLSPAHHERLLQSLNSGESSPVCDFLPESDVWDFQQFVATETVASCTGPVGALAVTGKYLFSAEGSRMMPARSLGDESSTIRVWDIHRKVLLTKLSGHTKGVRSLIIQDKILFSAGSDGTIRAWQAHKPFQSLGIMSGGPSGGLVYSLAFSGTNLYSGHADGSVRIWDYHTCTLHARIPAHKRGVWALAISDSGDRLFSGGNDGMIHVWSLSTRLLIASIRAHACGVWCLAFTQEGLLFSGSDDKTIRVWDATTLECRATLSGHTGHISMLLCIDHGRLLSASSDKTVRVWSTRALTCTHVLPLMHGRGVQALAYRTGCLFTGAYDGSILVWTLLGMSERWRALSLSDCLDAGLLPVQDVITSTLQSPCHVTRLVSSHADKQLRCWDLGSEGCQLVRAFPHPSTALCLAVAPTATMPVAVIGCMDGMLRAWHLEDLTEIGSWVASDRHGIRALAFEEATIAGDDTHLMASLDGMGMIKLWRWSMPAGSPYMMPLSGPPAAYVDAGRPSVSSPSAAQAAASLLMLPNRQVVVGGDKGLWMGIYTYHALSASYVWKKWRQVAVGSVRRLWTGQVARLGQVLLCGLSSGAMAVYCLSADAMPSLLVTLPCGRTAVRAALLSAGLLLTCTEDRQLKVWDLRATGSSSQGPITPLQSVVLNKGFGASLCADGRRIICLTAGDVAEIICYAPVSNTERAQVDEQSSMAFSDLYSPTRGNSSSSHGVA
jgi:WD40 repeat protein